MRIRNLRIENFRGFSRLEMKDLGRINLIVGANNSGKTTVLEAINVLMAGGDAWAIWSILYRRGETVWVAPRSGEAARLNSRSIDSFMTTRSAIRPLSGSRPIRIGARWRRPRRSSESAPPQRAIRKDPSPFAMNPPGRRLDPSCSSSRGARTDARGFLSDRSTGERLDDDDRSHGSEMPGAIDARFASWGPLLRAPNA